jgi:hypothetical protein
MKAGMKRSVFVLAVLCCGLLASAVGASSASAAFELTAAPCTGEIITLCWSKQEVGAALFELKGEEAFEALLDVEEEGEEHLIIITLGGEVVHIECEDTHATGTLLQNVPLTTVPTLDVTSFVFTNCKLLPEGAGLKCELNAASAKEIKTVALVGTPKTTEEIGFVPEAGTELTSFVIQKKGTATCLAAGTKKVTEDEPIVALLLEPEVDKAGHLLWIKEPRGLLIAEQPATLLDALELNLPTLELTDWWDLALG